MCDAQVFFFTSRSCLSPLDFSKLEFSGGSLATAMGVKRKSLGDGGKQAKSGKAEKPASCPTTEKLSQWLLGNASAMSFGETLELQTWQLKRLRSLIDRIRGSQRPSFHVVVSTNTS